MDRRAAKLLNLLLGNDEYDAVLEMCFPAAQIIFERDCVFAIGGADLSPVLDGEPLTLWRPYSARAGSELRFTEKRLGNWTYLVVAGGFELSNWLESASTNLAAGIGGFEGRKLVQGDVISLRAASKFARDNRYCVSQSLLPRYSRFPTVRVIPGAEFELLTQAGRKRFIDEGFEISKNSDRMGYRLIGPDLTLNGELEMVSAAVDFGTIQLLPDGQLIVLMAEGQTAGGYPRIGHVISIDLPLIGQLGPGDKVRFHPVEQGHAEELALEAEKELSFFRVGCRLQALSWTD
jgi:antagonist of KipI